SPGHHEMLVAECLQHLRYGDIEGRHAGWIELYAHRALALAADAHLADAVDGLKRLLDGIDGIGVELLQSAVALERQPHDWLGTELHLGDDGRFSVVRQPVEDLIDLCLYLIEGHVDRLVQIEGDNHFGGAGYGCGFDVVDAGHAVHRVCDDVGDRGVDDLRRCPLHGGGDRDQWKFGIGKAVYPHALEADGAKQHQHRRYHGGQHMAADGNAGQVHGSVALAADDVDGCAIGEKAGTDVDHQVGELQTGANLHQLVPIDTGFDHPLPGEPVLDDIGHGPGWAQHDRPLGDQQGIGPA